MRTLALVLFLSLALPACTVAKFAGNAIALPFKGLYHGAKFAGKTVYYTGKGVFMVGQTTVRVANGVLDGTERVLRLTILTANATGAVARTTKEISALSLEAELAAIEAAGKTTEVIIDIIR
jgi:hypothetical protein